VRYVARLGQQMGLTTYPLVNSTPRSMRSLRTVGMAHNVSERWSSVRIKTMSGCCLALRLVLILLAHLQTSSVRFLSRRRMRWLRSAALLIWYGSRFRLYSSSKPLPYRTYVNRLVRTPQ
jgi:hypothetical protein